MTSTVKRTDYTETSTHVRLTVYVAGATGAKRNEDLKHALVMVFTNRHGDQEHVIVDGRSRSAWEDIEEADAFKITVRLRKLVPGDKWEAETAPAMKPVTPYASGKSVADWDAKAGAEPEEENDHPNALFAKLFKNADPDARRAMQKSMLESGGTTLSDNWKDVGSRDMGKPEPVGAKVERKSA